MVEAVTAYSTTVGSWDQLIARYRGKTLFHETVWLRYLQETQEATPVFLELLSHGERVGLFSGLLVRKGPFRILGSPLPGWGTNYMGPLFDQCSLELTEVTRAIEDYAVKHLGVHHLEITCPIEVRTVDLRAVGYKSEAGMTYLVPLDRNDDVMLGRMTSTCRNRLRKGVKNGLIVEVASDEAIVDEYYDQLLEVFGKQGLAPTYSRARVRALFNHLEPAGRLLPLRVRDPNGVVVATGLFPCDEKEVYFWGGASWRRYQKLCPNELLHWSAMTLARDRGATQYNMCGKGSFKVKFGGDEVETLRWHKSCSLSASLGRRAFQVAFRMRQKVLGFLGGVGSKRRAVETRH